MLLHTVRLWMYWIWSRSARRIYSWFPVFGPLRGSIGIIESGGAYLVIDRSDGLGFCFPGGVANRAEGEVEALRRELREETGLILIDAQELFRFESNTDVPAVTSVFRATVAGTVRASWEGKPCWLTLAELERTKVFEAQQPVITYLKKLTMWYDH
jgi:8-oxo-dGTP diphosphatase